MEKDNVKNYKLESVKTELKALLRKLIEGGYNLTAETVFDHIANSGVEMDINPDLKNSLSMEEFLKDDE